MGRLVLKDRGRVRESKGSVVGKGGLGAPGGGLCLPQQQKVAWIVSGPDSVLCSKLTGQLAHGSLILRGNSRH